MDFDSKEEALAEYLELLIAEYESGKSIDELVAMQTGEEA